MNFEEYFQAIGIKDPIKKRIGYIFSIAKRLEPNEKFENVTINEYLDKEFNRHYESIRFYSENIAIVAHRFLTEEAFVVSNLNQTIPRVQFNVKDYDFTKATANSRIQILCEQHFCDSPMILKGTAENCDYIFEVYKRILKPRLHKLSSITELPRG